MGKQRGLGERLVETQERTGVGNQRLAEVTGAHINTVSKWRSGTQQPDAVALDAIARELRVTTTWLLLGDEPPDYPSPDRSPDRTAFGERPLPRVLRTHRVRVWLAGFRRELIKAGAADEQVEEAIDLLTAPQVFSYYRGGAPGELTEEEAIVAMEAIATGIRKLRAKRRRQEK